MAIMVIILLLCWIGISAFIALVLTTIRETLFPPRPTKEYPPPRPWLHDDPNRTMAS